MGSPWLKHKMKAKIVLARQDFIVDSFFCDEKGIRGFTDNPPSERFFPWNNVLWVDHLETEVKEE